jgi:hypothetical protein
MRTLVFCGMAVGIVAQPSEVDVFKCGQRCTEIGKCCEGLDSSCGQPSCAEGCLMAAATPTAAQCTDTCAAARKASNGCSFEFKNQSYQFCANCPSLPVACPCPTPDECELGCQLAYGAAIPLPTPAPTAPYLPIVPVLST